MRCLLLSKPNKYTARGQVSINLIIIGEHLLFGKEFKWSELKSQKNSLVSRYVSSLHEV